MAALGLPVIMVLIAAVAKFADLAAFAADLKSWTLLPQWSIGVVAVVVPAMELALTLVWLSGMARRFATVALVLLLAAVSVAYSLQAWVAPPPNCGCFGRILAFRSSARESQQVVLLDVTLLGLALVGACLSQRGTRGRQAQEQESGVRAPDIHGRGFSLLEVVLVVALIGVLVSLLAPSLGSVRDRARDAQSLANLRTHTQVFSMYAIDWQDHFPFFADPTRATTPILNPHQNRVVTVPYFLSYFLWPIALADPYYDGDDRSEVFYHPGAGRWRAEIGETQFSAPYSYGCCFIAVPDYWNRTTRRRGLSQLRATLMSQVTFPAAKVLLSEPYPALQVVTVRGGSLAKMGLGTVDGSARRLLYGSLLQGELGDTSELDARTGHTNPFPAPLHTREGVRGRDIP